MADWRTNEPRTVFNQDQKNDLAMHIAASFSCLLGSSWIGEGWSSEDIYFLCEKRHVNQLPRGPFIMCSSDGPESKDWMRWTGDLGDTPQLIPLGKPLLEIDSGQDLGELIDDGLKATTTKSIFVLLLG